MSKNLWDIKIVAKMFHTSNIVDSEGIQMICGLLEYPETS